jgi:23S rRNA (cytosine1962-C5)-methyltransferase
MNKQILLRKNEEHRLNSGHQWIFSNEIRTILGDPQAGDVVEILRSDGRFLGMGFYNPNSLIAFRLLTRGREEISSEFFTKRVEQAAQLRQRIYPNASSYRIVHGESDFLPGLIIDKYNDYFVIQTLSFGIDLRLPVMCDIVESLFHPRGIVERNDAATRSLEGLPLKKGIMRGSLEESVIDENGVRYTVDLLNGQKTGFFLDQRENRNAVRRFSKNASVLDCFSNEGGFALNAALAGAQRVLGIDSSEHAVAQAMRNVKLNGLDNVEIQVDDVFERLKTLAAGQERFDLVILDPPSFTRNKKNVATALRGYKEINTLALQLLNPGGILMSASCSHHITKESFFSVIAESSAHARRSVRMLEFSGAAPDHPVILSMPETEYLKFGIFAVV